MTSEERAKQFLDQAEPTLYAYDLEFLTSQFDQHAAEQREKDADLADEVLLNQHPGKTMKEVIMKQGEVKDE